MEIGLLIRLILLGPEVRRKAGVLESERKLGIGPFIQRGVSILGKPLYRVHSRLADADIRFKYSGWLVTEPFICPSLYEKYLNSSTGPVLDEWTLSIAMGDRLSEEMEDHYKTFIVRFFCILSI